MEDSNWSNMVFTPMELIPNTFELFQLGIKESWKACAPQCPFAQGMEPQF